HLHSFPTRRSSDLGPKRQWRVSALPVASPNATRSSSLQVAITDMSILSLSKLEADCSRMATRTVRAYRKHLPRKQSCFLSMTSKLCGQLSGKIGLPLPRSLSSPSRRMPDYFSREKVFLNSYGR